MRAICLYRDESITAQRDIGVVAVSDIRLLPGPKFKMRLSHTFFMYPGYRNIHIGRIIDARIKAAGMTYARFARLLCIERTTVYNIIRSKSIDTERLIRIGQILGYDFLRNVYLAEDGGAAGRLHVVVNGVEIPVDGSGECKISIKVSRDAK